MTTSIKEKHRNIWAGIIASVFILAMVAFGEYVGVSEQQSVLANAKLKGVLFLFGAAIFVGVVIWLMDENKELEQYRIAAITDPLTGLLNRRGGERALRRELGAIFREQYGQSSEPIGIAVIFIDVDHFKPLNDELGHAAGDRVIALIANLIQDSFERETDIVTRQGGDEFVAILLQAGTSAALRRSQGLLTAIDSSKMLSELIGNGNVKRPTLSIGIASGFIRSDNPWEALMEDIFERADNEMYEVKRAGGNNVSDWGPVN